MCYLFSLFWGKVLSFINPACLAFGMRKLNKIISRWGRNIHSNAKSTDSVGMRMVANSKSRNSPLFKLRDIRENPPIFFVDPAQGFLNRQTLPTLAGPNPLQTFGFGHRKIQTRTSEHSVAFSLFPQQSD